MIPVFFVNFFFFQWSVKPSMQNYVTYSLKNYIRGKMQLPEGMKPWLLYLPLETAGRRHHFPQPL